MTRKNSKKNLTSAIETPAIETPQVETEVLTVDQPGEMDRVEELNFIEEHRNDPTLEEEVSDDTPLASEAAESLPLMEALDNLTPVEVPLTTEEKVKLATTEVKIATLAKSVEERAARTQQVTVLGKLRGVITQGEKEFCCTLVDGREAKELKAPTKYGVVSALIGELSAEGYLPPASQVIWGQNTWLVDQWTDGLVATAVMKSGKWLSIEAKASYEAALAR